MQHGGVESCVKVMSANNSNLALIKIANNTLLRIANAPKGATAVATRGGSRQLLRVLPGIAAFPSREADEVVLVMLQVLDAVASGGSESADILRKQGVIDVAIDCADLKKGDAAAAAAEATETAGDGSGGAGQAAGQEKTVAYTTDPVTRASIQATVTSIFSKLVTPEEVTEAISLVCAYANIVQTSTARFGSGAGDAARTDQIKLPGIEPGQLVGAIRKLGLMADTEAARRVGTPALNSGAAACVLVAQCALAVARSRASYEERTGKSAGDLGDVESEIANALPLSIRTVKLILSALAQARSAAEAAGVAIGDEELAHDTAIASVPVLISTLEIAPEVAAEAMQCLSVLTKHKDAAAVVPGSSSGRGIDILVNAMRRATELGDELTICGAMTTLSAVGAVDTSNLVAMINSGASSLALSLLGDLVQESAQEIIEATIGLLSQLVAHSEVADEAVYGGIFLLLRAVLQRFCSDPEHPAPTILAGVALISAWCSIAPSVVGADGAERLAACRDIYRRVARVAMSANDYTDSYQCMKQILTLILRMCSPAAYMPTHVQQDNVVEVVACSTEDLIVMGMSSSAAVQEILNLGAAALVVIGAGSQAERLQKEVDRLIAAILGGNATSQALKQLGDGMRGLSVSIASSEQDPTQAIALAPLYATVNGALRAAVSRIQSPGELQIVTDILNISAQTTGRIIALGGLASSPPALSVADACATLRYVLSASQDGRVIESVVRAVETLVRAGGSRAVYDAAEGGLLSTMLAAHDAAKAYWEACEAAVASGTLPRNYDAAKHAAASKSIGQLRAAVRLITATFRGNVRDFITDAGCSSVPVVTELVLGAAVCSLRTPDEESAGVDEGDLRDTLDGVVGAPGGTPVVWSVLEAFVSPEFQGRAGLTDVSVARAYPLSVVVNLLVSTRFDMLGYSCLVLLVECCRSAGTDSRTNCFARLSLHMAPTAWMSTSWA